MLPICELNKLLFVFNRIISLIATKTDTISSMTSSGTRVIILLFQIKLQFSTENQFFSSESRKK